MNKIIDIILTILGILTYELFFTHTRTWDRHKIREYQFKKLKKLLIYSQKCVPYYTDLFERIHFDPKKDFNCLSDLKKLPVLEKDYVRKNQSLFYSKQRFAYRLFFSTSGSTGQPLNARVGISQWITEQAVVWRSWRHAGYKFRDKVVVIRSYAPKNSEEIIKKDILRNFHYFSPFHLNTDNMNSYAEYISVNKIKFIRGYPSSLEVFAKHIIQRKLKLTHIHGVFTASEVLTKECRKTLEAAFGANVYDYYGLAEQIVSFSDCRCQNGLRNNDIYGYLELHRTNDNLYRIVGTNLNNTMMPLIRYDTGDLAKLSSLSSGCDCQESSHIIEAVIGRSDVTIKTTTGVEIPTVNFYTVLEHYPVKAWQIVQLDLREISINLHTLENFKNERALTTRVELDFAKRLPDDIKINVKFNKDFIQSTEGKRNAFVSLVYEN
ncbi:hypothetical protein N9767_01260 [Planktomarina temperata]|nr:hypothetical protein [Planktomarina temperata]